MTKTNDSQPAGDWASDEFRRIAAADELRVSALRSDGTLREPTTIWVVPVQGHLFIRSTYGTSAAWWLAARGAGRGRIRAGGVEKDVAFIDATPGFGPGIDDSYRTKYRRYSRSLVNTMTAPDARATTLELKPRGTT